MDRKRNWKQAKPTDKPNFSPEEKDLRQSIMLMTQRRRDEILARIVTKRATRV